MKIVFIGGRDIHIIGGIESYMRNLSSVLVRMGHEPIVYCESNRHEIENMNGVKVIHYKSFGSAYIDKPLLGLRATLRTLMKERGVGVIHYNAWPPSLWCWIPRLFGVKSLMHGHGLEWQRSKYSPRQQSVLLFMEKVTAYLNQHLIMCSNAQTRYFKSVYNRDAVTISTAINLPENKDVESDILERFGLEPRKYFLSMGRLVKDKNPDVLIEAFKKAKHAGYKLVIAGSNDADMPYVESLHKLAEGDDDIVFTGSVYGTDKEKLLQQAFVFCLPSTIEGLAIALLEAMSYRLPIIASDIEANQEVLSGDDALWCKAEDEKTLKDAIEQSIEKRDDFVEIVERNYRKVEAHYTWDKVAEKYIAHLKDLGCK